MADGFTAGPAARSRRRREFLRFAAVGASGVVVNLGVLNLCAGWLGLPELLASALAVEASILSNFALNDRFTFRGREGGGRAGRLARYHAVSAVGMALQLAVFALAVLLAAGAGRGELGPLRSPAQAAGIALAFAWSWRASSRWAWAAPGPGARLRGGQARSAPVAAWIFAALLLLHVLSIWLVRWVPTQDGPLHVENVLALLLRPASPLLQHYYLPNWGTQPNWLTQLLLLGLLPGTPGPVAEKVVLTGYTVLLPLAFRAVLPPGRRGWWAALAVFPFLHSFPFYMGFWNFCWGLGLALLTVALWQRARGRLGPGRFVALALLAACLYAAHAVAFAGALVAILALWLARLLPALRRARGRPSRRRLVLRGHLGRGAALAAAVAPGLLLLLSFMLRHRDRAVARIPLPELAAKLAAGYALVSIDRRELFVAAAVALCTGLAAARLLWLRARRPGLLPADGWLLAALSFFALYFAVPDVAAAGAHISDRLALLGFLSLLAWVGARASPTALVRATGLSLAALALVGLVVRFQKAQVLSGYLAEYVGAGAAVGQGAVLLPLSLAPGGPRDGRGRRLGYRIKPFLHAAGWIVAARGGIDLKNSQANTDQCPVRFPPERNPFRIIAGSVGRMESVPPCVDLRLAPRVGRIDYLVVSGATRENLETPCGAALAAELAARFQPVYLSVPTGLVEVWRPRERMARN